MMSYSEYIVSMLWERWERRYLCESQAGKDKEDEEGGVHGREKGKEC